MKQQMKTNWIDTLTPEQQDQSYYEITKYFTEQVVHEVLEKYNNSLDFDSDSL